MQKSRRQRATSAVKQADGWEPDNAKQSTSKIVKATKSGKKQKEGQEPIKQQRVLDDLMVIRIPSKHKAQVDEELTSCLYQTGKPFDFFDNDC